MFTFAIIIAVYLVLGTLALGLCKMASDETPHRKPARAIERRPVRAR